AFGAGSAFAGVDGGGAVALCFAPALSRCCAGCAGAVGASAGCNGVAASHGALSSFVAAACVGSGSLFAINCSTNLVAGAGSAVGAVTCADASASSDFALASSVFASSCFSFVGGAFAALSAGLALSVEFAAARWSSKLDASALSGARRGSAARGGGAIT